MTRRPSCYLDCRAEEVMPREGAAWAYDMAASCRAYPHGDNDWPAECLGCGRRLRAVALASGSVTPYPSRKTKEPAHV